MRDVRERIEVIAEEIFELEMSEREDKFWNDLLVNMSIFQWLLKEIMWFL